MGSPKIREAPTSPIPASRGVVTWRTTRLWRFALSHARKGVVWDGAGRRRHVSGPVWVLTDRGVWGEETE